MIISKEYFEKRITEFLKKMNLRVICINLI